MKYSAYPSISCKQATIALAVLCTTLLQSRADLDAGLVAHYSFSGNANDLSGNGNHGTVEGAYLTTDRNGKANAAYSFDGFSSRIRVADSATLHLSTSFTVSSWFLQKSAGAPNVNYSVRIIDKNTAGRPDGFDLCAGSLSDKRISCDAYPGLVSDRDSEFDRWHHLVVTVDGNQGAMYLDGSVVASSSAMSVPANSLPLIIGAPQDTGYQNHFYGSIDDVRIYNRALSPTEVAQLWEKPASTIITPLPSYQYNGENGRMAITDPKITANNEFSFTFATIDPGARCVISWTDNLKDWKPLATFTPSACGTEIKDPISTPKVFYRATYPPSGVSLADSFRYPIGNGTVLEQITPERNNLYFSGAIANPERGATSPGAGWYNAQDVGSYYAEYSVNQGKWLWEGLHPGEDWNFKGDTPNAGQPIKAVANGQVIEIRPAGASGNPSTSGYAVVIRHWLVNGDAVDSLYVHLAPDTHAGVFNSSGAIGAESDFTFQVGASVSKSNVIGVIGAVSALPPHLHFEMRNKPINVSGLLWPKSTGDAYYGPEIGPAGNRSQPMSEPDVKAAFRLMHEDEGIIDPSDFIDDHR